MFELTFCQNCGIEIAHANSHQKLCSECRNIKKSKKNSKANEELIKDSINARKLGIPYSKYSELRRTIKKIIIEKKNGGGENGT